MLVNLEVPDDVVNTMLRLHDATKRIEARYNSHISAHNGYQASLDRTGRRGRPAFIITAEQLTFLLEHSATEDRILPLLRPYKIPHFDEIFGGIGTVPALLTTKQN